MDGNVLLFVQCGFDIEYGVGGLKWYREVLPLKNLDVEFTAALADGKR